MYPKGKLAPINAEKNGLWEEYRFSDILSSNGFELVAVRLDYGCEHVDIKTPGNFVKARKFWVVEAVAREDDDISLFYFPPSRYKENEKISPLHPYEDVVVRYYLVGGVVFRPVWTSLCVGGMLMEETGSDVVCFSKILSGGWGISRGQKPEISDVFCVDL